MLGRDSADAIVEFWEMIWAKQRSSWRRARHQPAGLEPRAVEALWLGVYEATGENIVVGIEPGAPAFRVRTVTRRPFQDRGVLEARVRS